MKLRRNSAGVVTAGDQLAANQNPGSASPTPVTLAVVEYQFSVGDHIELFALQSSGGALALSAGSAQTFLRMKLVGP